MFGVYQNGIVHGARNVWSEWADRVLQKKRHLGFSKVAMVTTCGEVLWYTGDFLSTSHEIKILNRLFDENTNNNGLSSDLDRITIQGRTYITKSVIDDVSSSSGTTVRQLVAFNGYRHVLITRSKMVYIIVLTEGHIKGHPWLTDALGWLLKLSYALVKANY